MSFAPLETVTWGSRLLADSERTAFSVLLPPWLDELTTAAIGAELVLEAMSITAAVREGSAALIDVFERAGVPPFLDRERRSSAQRVVGTVTGVVRRRRRRGAGGNAAYRWDPALVGRRSRVMRRTSQGTHPCSVIGTTVVETARPWRMRGKLPGLLVDAMLRRSQCLRSGGAVESASGRHGLQD